MLGGVLKMNWLLAIIVILAIPLSMKWNFGFKKKGENSVMKLLN